MKNYNDIDTAANLIVNGDTMNIATTPKIIKN